MNGVRRWLRAVVLDFVARLYATRRSKSGWAKLLPVDGCNWRLCPLIGQGHLLGVGRLVRTTRSAYDPAPVCGFGCSSTHGFGMSVVSQTCVIPPRLANSPAPSVTAMYPDQFRSLQPPKTSAQRLRSASFGGAPTSHLGLFGRLCSGSTPSAVGGREKCRSSRRRDAVQAGARVPRARRIRLCCHVSAESVSLPSAKHATDHCWALSISKQRAGTVASNAKTQSSMPDSRSVETMQLRACRTSA